MLLGLNAAFPLAPSACTFPTVKTTLCLEGRVLGLITTWCWMYTKELFSPKVIDHHDTICSTACAYAGLLCKLCYLVEGTLFFSLWLHPTSFLPSSTIVSYLLHLLLISHLLIFLFLFICLPSLLFLIVTEINVFT